MNVFSRVLVAAAVAVVGLVVACSSSDDSPAPNCTTDRCACTGAACDLDCGSAASCQPACSSFSGHCNAACGDKCSFACTNGPSCNAACGADCTISCTSTSTCNATCGEHCTFTCANAENCAPSVGDGSNVTCTSTQNCHPVCTGTCRVHCTSGPHCTVTCPSGVTATPCADGWTCGGSC